MCVFSLNSSKKKYIKKEKKKKKKNKERNGIALHIIILSKNHQVMTGDIIK